jgi:NAD(P)-dependent dehydrogenase (short-subunit alcohol dehydrogenase family)
VVVNNAGILRDRMLVNMGIDEWDAVIRVHLRGTFSLSQQAAVRWREQAKTGDLVDARIINTTSPTGLYGNVGQTNYGAAKAGIAQFSVIAAMELGRYGITVNAISPSARTRMTETLKRPDLGYGREQDDNTFDESAPENVSPLVVWLASSESKGINGKVFNVRGGHVSVAEPWVGGPPKEIGRQWQPEELGAVIPELVAKSRGQSTMRGKTIEPSA